MLGAGSSSGCGEQFPGLSLNALLDMPEDDMNNFKVNMNNFKVRG